MPVNLALIEATADNLDEAAYLAANPDVAQAGLTARDHFEHHGRAEGRKQMRPEAARNIASYRRDKFLRFRKVLAAPFDRRETFPIVTSPAHFDSADYAVESANPGFGPFDAEVEAHPDRLYLDLGCGFRETVRDNCLYLEVYPSRSADLIVEPNCLYPILSGTLDGIGCFAVLEHTRKPWLVVEEMKRMLKPGGKVFIDWPFLQPVHGYPSHFFNATREGLSSLFEDNGFRVELCTTGAHETAAYTITWILRSMTMGLPEGALRSRFEAMTVAELVALDVQSETWREWVGALPPQAVSELACGNWLMATRST